MLATRSVNVLLGVNVNVNLPLLDILKEAGICMYLAGRYERPRSNLV